MNESDVELADASEAVIIGFHVGIDEGARNLAERRGIEIRTYSVIYEIYDDIKLALSGLLEPEVRESYQGTAEGPGHVQGPAAWARSPGATSPTAP